MSSNRQSPEPAPSSSLAIALQGEGSARPRVVASGRGALAEQILEIAFANDVKVRSDADLAEILAAVDVDSEIPLAALATVAEILSYVYRAEQGVGQRRSRSPDTTETADRKEDHGTP